MPGANPRRIGDRLYELLGNPTTELIEPPGTLKKGGETIPGADPGYCVRRTKVGEGSGDR